MRGSFATTPAEAISHWTPARQESAEPMSVIPVPPPAPEAAVPLLHPRRTAFGSNLTAQPGAVQGVEVGLAESTLFPGRANGKVYGEYRIGAERKPYECSGSVIDSPDGDLVLTAAHCVIDPVSGKVASFLTFIPAYRGGSEPYGRWGAAEYSIPEAWTKTAGTAFPNEGGDIALLKIKEFEDQKSGTKVSVEEVVGSLGIAFDQACNQIYTQYGYPADPPYGGEILYSHIAPYAGADTNPHFFPQPMKIASDFTEGASGGPWTVGPTSAPTVLSLTNYFYESQPGYVFGAYFGEAARKAYELAAEKVVPIGIEESCKPLPGVPTHTEPAPSPPGTPTPPPPAEGKPVTLKLTRVRRRANGSAVLTAKVSAAGMLRLRGAAVRAESLNTPAAGKYRLVVATKGRTTRRLRRNGRAKVGVKVAFRASGKTRRVSRKIRLSRRRPVRQQASRSHARVRRNGADRVPSARG